MFFFFTCGTANKISSSLHFQCDILNSIIRFICYQKSIIDFKILKSLIYINHIAYVDQFTVSQNFCKSCLFYRKGVSQSDFLFNADKYFSQTKIQSAMVSVFFHDLLNFFLNPYRLFIRFDNKQH